MQQKQQWGNRESFNLLVSYAASQAICVTAVSRTGFGSEALGIPGIGAFVVWWVWVLATHSPDLMYLCGVWVLAMLAQRVRTMKDNRDGSYRHSLYTGFPMLTGRIVKNERLAKVMEGVAWFWLGYVFQHHPTSGVVGNFFMASGAAIVFMEILHAQTERKQKQAVRDAEIEGRFLNNRKGVMTHG